MARDDLSALVPADLVGIFDNADAGTCMNCRAEIGDDYAVVRFAIEAFGTPVVCGQCVELTGFEFSGLEVISRVRPAGTTGRQPLAGPRQSLP